MNKQSYRVIFSKVIGIFIAVAENARSHHKTKSSGNGVIHLFRNLLRGDDLRLSNPRHSHVQQYAHPQLTNAYYSFERGLLFRRCTILSVLIAALFAPLTLVHAQMVAYKNGAAPQPIIDQSANGKTVVQIVTPNATGLSHNRYEQFNVDQSGVILNNSSTIIPTQLGGYIEGNPNLSSSNAKIILNEVMGTHHSQLQGYIEVAGQKADVIVANPNGISVGNGAGFINTSRGVLTTGTPTLDGDGSLAGFRVTQGDIRIEAGGMNANEVDQLDLIARSVQVNDALWAKQLNVLVGSNQINYTNLGVQVIAGEGNQPTVGIDTSNLGGMYAQKIMLVGTEAGVGVKTLGTISASAGDITIDSHGKINLNGQTNATGQIRLHSDDGINNTGTLYGKQAVQMASNGQVTNSGTLAAQHNLTIEAASIDSSGVLGAGIRDTGEAREAGNLLLTSSGSITTTGKISAGGNIIFTGSNLYFADENAHANTHAYGNILFSATAGDIDHRGATLTAEGSSVLKAVDNIINDVGVIQADHLELTANAISNVAGQLLQSGTGNTHITTTNLFNNANGTVATTNDLYLQAGGLVSHGYFYTGRDANIIVQSDATLTDDIVFHTNRDFIFTTSGTLTNTTDLESVGNLTLNAAHIINKHEALINSGNGSTILKALHEIDNMGRIYGNDIAIQTAKLTNGGILDGEGKTLQAGVIAARRDLDIGADNIFNREHAVLQSLGNMSIGGVLDGQQRAAGKASLVQNASATIDAGGDLNLQVARLDNLNLHFETELRKDPSATGYVKYYMLEGSPVQYYDGVDAVVKNEDDIDKLVLLGDESRHNDYTIFYYLKTTEHSEVLRSDPANIMAGRQIVLSGQINNDKSRIVAGGAITGDLSGLTNTDAKGKIRITKGGDGEVCLPYPLQRTCIPRSYSQYHTTSKDTFGSRDDNYHNKVAVSGSEVLTPNLNIAAYIENQNPEHLHNDAIGVDVDRSNVPTGEKNTPIQLPSNQLFPITTNPNADYLIETDPQFTNYAVFLSSEYMLERLGINPTVFQKRLGDGFYEQKLINDQILQLTGKRFLGDYTTNEQQYQALMESGLKMAEQFQLTPGIALTADQMAALTSDMVWLVSKEVTLPDGSKNQVLVPTVYLAQVDKVNVLPTGAIIAGRDVGLSVSGTLQNGGTLQANNALIKATDIINTGTLKTDAEKGNAVLVADNDILNSGGAIAGKNVALSAGRDVIMSTTVSENETSSGNVKHGFRSEQDVINNVASISADQLTIQSGRDISLTATQIDTKGDANLAAGRDINLNTVTTKDAFTANYDTKNNLSVSQTNVIGNQITIGGNLTLAATQDINAKAAYVNTTGELTATAGRDINLDSTKQESHYSQQTYSSSSGLLSSSSRATETQQHSTQSVGTTLSADKVHIVAGNNINVTGSNIASTNDMNVVAGNDINISTSEDHAYQSYRKEEKTSGIFSSGGIGVTIGSKSQDDRYQDSSTLHRGSLIGSVSGNVTLAAGSDLSIKGSDVIAQKDTNFTARNIDISQVQNELIHAEQHEMKQSGLTLSVSSPITNVATSVAQSVQRANEVDDPRLKNFYAAKAAAEIWTNYDSMKNEATQLANGNLGSVSLNLSIGSSQSSSTSENQLNYAQGSQLRAGGNLNLIATGEAGATNQGNIHISGSQLAANDIALNASNDILIQSAQNTRSNRAENDSSGWSAGVGISLGEQTGFTFSASGHQGNGNQNGNGTEHIHSQINAKNGIAIVSGRDTTLQGAVVSGKQISADIARNLTINSLQDEENYRSRQENMSAGASFNYGTGTGSASFSMNQSSTDADYASVKQQSGLFAGEGGFNVNVGSHTQLNGGIIASNATPDKNHVSTGSLGVTDISNHKKIDSQADGFGIGMGAGALYEAGKAAMTALASNAGEQGSATSQTRATISHGDVEIRSGATDVLETINRDAQVAHNSLENYNVEQIAQDTQNRSEAGQVIASIATQFLDKAHDSLFGTVNGDTNKVYRVVCKQEPCTFDPAIQSDPNRRDSEGNPNIVMVEMAQEQIRNLSEEERKNIVLATNGIMNSVQRGGELALQNADTIDAGQTENTGNSKPDVLLVTSPHSGNVISELIVAGYEKSLASLFGYSNADHLLAETADSLGLDTTLLGHSRGSLVVNNAMQILVDQGKLSDALKVQVKGPAISEEKIRSTINQLRTSEKASERDIPEYSYFPNDLVSTIVGGASNGDRLSSLKKTAELFLSDTSPHSCYGSGIAGCTQVEKPYSYDGLNPVDLQKLRQEQVNSWLRQGKEYGPVINPVSVLLSPPVYFQKNTIWGIGAMPVEPKQSRDERMNQLRTLFPQ